MIKATGELDGRRTLFLGLSAVNVRRLQQNEPIVFDLAEMGWGTGQVVIMFGETEEVIADRLLGGKRI